MIGKDTILCVKHLVSKENAVLSDKKTARKKVPVRKPTDFQKSWGDKQKLEAVNTYVVLGGNAQQTAIALQIPQETLRKWTKTTWWKELYDEVKQEDNIFFLINFKTLSPVPLLL